MKTRLVSVSIDIRHPSLFGNEAAEDEAEDVFFSFWVNRPEEELFIDPSIHIGIVYAYKGEGKSGLLRAAKNAVQLKGKDGSGPIIVTTTGPVTKPELENIDTANWNRGWKRALLDLIAGEIGSTIGMAWNDDAIGLVEFAEKKGFRKKSFITSVVERLASPKLPITKTVSTPDNLEKSLNRQLQNDSEIWLFVDDVDRNYQDTRQWAASLAGFFDAIRDLTNAIPQLRVRTCIRPNVWAAINQTFESLSHIRQYLIPLVWSEDDALSLLARRVEGFLQRTNQLDAFRGSAKTKHGTREHQLELISLGFNTPVEWGRSESRKKIRPIHVPIFTLGKHRPRWMVELCKLAAVAAKKHRGNLIGISHITEVMDEFGRRRKSDLVAEFGPQCPQLAELVDAFHGQPEELSTADLLTLVEKRILNHVSPLNISGVAGKPNSREVASFLFEIGFIFGRKDISPEEYEHIAYADSPNLLESRTNLDAGLRWEIHPVFRQALEMRDATGKVTAKASKRRGGRAQ